MVDFGQKLKTLRKEKGLTQVQLARRIGVTKSVVSAYETSSRYPSYDVLIKFASIFGVSTDYLLGVEKNRTLDISPLTPEQQRAVAHIVELLKPHL